MIKLEVDEAIKRYDDPKSRNRFCEEINLRSASYSEIVNMMKDKAVAPTFVIVAEPELTEILAQQQREHWGLRYQR